MRILNLMVLSGLLQACVADKPIEYREIEIVKPKNRLEFGNNWNNLNVDQDEQIKPIKYPKPDFFYDK
jgi:hypothetical protein